MRVVGRGVSRCSHAPQLTASPGGVPPWEAFPQMNRALVEGFVEALNVRGMSVTCEPGRDGCCVTLRFDS